MISLVCAELVTY